MTVICVPAYSELVILQANFMLMLSSELANFYERDLRKLIEEINLFQSEDNLWKTAGTVKNSAGNLVLHIVGGTNYLIGASLANTGYTRDRDKEFAIKGLERKFLIAQLEALIPIINKTLTGLTQEDMDAPYPLPFDDMMRSKNYVLVQLLLHLNYHLGQVNYLRRILEKNA